MSKKEQAEIQSDWTYERVRFETKAWKDPEGYHEFYKGRRNRVLSLDGRELDRLLTTGYGYEILEMDAKPSFDSPTEPPFWANV